MVPQMHVEHTYLLLIPVYILVDNLVAGNCMDIIPSPHANLPGTPILCQPFHYVVLDLLGKGRTLRLSKHMALVLLQKPHRDGSSRLGTRFFLAHANADRNV